MAINLLPVDLTPQTSVTRLVFYTKKITTIAFGLFVVSLLASLGYLFVLSSQIQSATAEKESLKASLASLEQTEQSMVLLRDRLTKINSVLSVSDSFDGVSNFGEVQNQATALGITVRDVEMAPGRTEFTILLTDSSLLVNLVASLAQNENYKRIELSSFNFNPTSGYFVTFVLFE